MLTEKYTQVLLDTTQLTGMCRDSTYRITDRPLNDATSTCTYVAAAGAKKPMHTWSSNL